MGNTASSLVSELLEIINPDRVEDPALAGELDVVRSRLSQPLRIVLAGRVSSGKSTLLNALLRHKIAPTDASDCTRVATWYQFGHPEQLEIRLTNGTTREMHLGSDGRLPSQFSVPTDEIQDMRVSLTNDALRDFTLVDTPGFSTGEPRTDEEEDDEVLDRRTREAAANCDAMIVVLNQTLRADELQVLRSFERQGYSASAVNAIGALTKADLLSDDGSDPVDTAATLAKRFAGRHSRDLADVIPIFGLLGESAETGTLTNQDVIDLERLSELDPERIQHLISSVDRFRSAECAVPTKVRSELLMKLGLFGINTSLSLILNGAHSAGALNRELTRTSGLEHLRSRLLEGFAERAVPLRLLWSLDTLRIISYRQGMSPEFAKALRDTIDRIRFDDALHEVREMEAFQKLCRGDIELPPDLEDDLRRLALDRDPVLRLAAENHSPETLRHAAQAGAARWRRARLQASPANDEVARTVVRSYALALAAAQSQ